MIKKLSAAALFLCLGTSCSHAVEWYFDIRPGATHAEILKSAGKPSSSEGQMDTYVQPKGRIECKYEKDILQSAIYYDTPDGAVSETLYFTNGDPKDTNLEKRRAYLKNGDFTVVPVFSGSRVYTHKYGGPSYDADGGFIVIEPIIALMGGVGFYADKAARVRWIKPDGTETILYRAADHWQGLKPPGLAESAIKSRTIKLKEAGQKALKMTVSSVFGNDDSEMGSGIDYKLFYLEDGLAIVTSDYPSGVIRSIFIIRPGLSNLTFDEWLKGAPSAEVAPLVR